MMRSCTLFCAMAVLSMVVIGCKPGSDAKTDTKAKAGAQTDAQVDVQAHTKRAEAVKAFHARLTEADQALVSLKSRIEKATGAEKTALEAKLKKATGHHESLKKKAEELKAATAEKWDNVKKDADKLFDEFQHHVK